VQVSYLGFPGSMGADFIDYLIGDPYLTPPAMQDCYTERLALLPRCYQVSPSAGPSLPAPKRQDVGLPEGAVVFSCFNNTYKILPAMFDVWMRLLRQVPGSVLWLARSNAEAEAALRREAASRGVDSARLVFAPLVDLELHLARLPLADVFLDTAPYTAGATASLTLRAGVPLVTLAGQTYVGRMAASLLQALNLPQLVAADPATYEAIALRLANDADERAALRRRIVRGVGELFGTHTFARDLEQLFHDMWTRDSREPAASLAAT
jgi:predicted O-linked N-acetylglucosamine transferase (SPINDLY family)